VTVFNVIFRGFEKEIAAMPPSAKLFGEANFVLPTEISLLIFSFLSGGRFSLLLTFSHFLEEALLRCQTVSKAYRAVALNAQLWKSLYTTEANKWKSVVTRYEEPVLLSSDENEAEKVGKKNPIFVLSEKEERVCSLSRIFYSLSLSTL
jgi:hypothetical protein